MMRPMLRKMLLLAPAAAVAWALAGPSVMANPAPSRARAETPREESVRRVHELLDDQQVRDRLQQAGLDRQEIEKRLDRLSDAQVRQLAEQMDSLGVGSGALGVVIFLLVVAALVLLIIYLADRV